MNPDEDPQIPSYIFIVKLYIHVHQGYRVLTHPQMCRTDGTDVKKQLKESAALAVTRWVYVSFGDGVMVSCTSCTFYQVAMCSGLCVFFCSGLGPQKRWTPKLCLEHICFTGGHRINVAGKALLQNYTMMYGILALYCNTLQLQNAVTYHALTCPAGITGSCMKLQSTTHWVCHWGVSVQLLRSSFQAASVEGTDLWVTLAQKEGSTEYGCQKNGGSQLRTLPAAHPRLTETPLILLAS